MTTTVSIDVEALLEELKAVRLGLQSESDEDIEQAIELLDEIIEQLDGIDGGE